ncbi:hypothetical protein HN51_049714 [Arachis hypogaea]|nr:uncharacterized protein LOC112766643 [Arachis hypogaea]
MIIVWLYAKPKLFYHIILSFTDYIPNNHKMMKPFFVAFLLLASLIFLPSSTLAARILAHNQRGDEKEAYRIGGRTALNPNGRGHAYPEGMGRGGGGGHSSPFVNPTPVPSYKRCSANNPYQGEPCRPPATK